MKKMLPWLVSLLLAITLIVIVALYFWNTLSKNSDANAATPDKQAQESVKDVKAKPLSADEILKVTSELNDIKTNIADTDYVVTVSFSFQFDSESAMKEFDKVKEIQIKPIVNRALWVMQPDQLSGTQGKDELCAQLLNEINPVLTKGKLSKVEITNFIMVQV